MVDEARDAEYVLGRSQDEASSLSSRGCSSGLRRSGCCGRPESALGCGSWMSGAVSRGCAPVSELVGGQGEVVGVDVDEVAVRFAEQGLRHSGVRFSGVVGDFRSVALGASDLGGVNSGQIDCVSLRY